MVLADTSVWVKLFREGEPHLAELLDEGRVVTHRFVIGELACGTMHRRFEILTLLRVLPASETVKDEEILTFIEERRLMGRGIGLVDVHLLASALLSSLPLWTLDSRLESAARELGVAYVPEPGD